MLSALLWVSTLASSSPLADGGAEQRWVIPSSVSVHQQPRVDAPALGELERGDQVEVQQCVPDCEDPRGWALISPRGAVRLAALSKEVLSDQAPVDAPYLYGHALLAEAPVRTQPSPRSGVLRREPSEFALAFIDDPELLRQGWLRSASGGYMAAGQVRLAGPPSTFAGVHDPPPTLAFFLRTVPRALTDGGPQSFARHQAAADLSFEGRGTIRVDGTVVPRSAIRLALQHQRPAGVQEGQRWVHVDLAEQTLTAYEGDREVFATLVSTGKPGFRTASGTFRVWLKVWHSTMTGRHEPYHVEQVPDVMFFHGGDALHGAFWHDSFGWAITHGCVNLSPRDADWLFGWAPPTVPDGWHAVRPQSEEESLWVVVEPGRSPSAPRPLAPPVPVTPDAGAQAEREDPIR